MHVYGDSKWMSVSEKMILICETRMTTVFKLIQFQNKIIIIIIIAHCNE